MLSLSIAGGIFLLDHKIKEHVDSTRLQGSREEVLGGRVILRNCHNKNMVFGKIKLDEESCRELSLAGLGCVLGEYWHELIHGRRLGRMGLAMVLGGGMSNYMDRRNKGYVTDYISFRTSHKKLQKIVFNLSDVCIIAGTGLWLLSGLLPSHKNKTIKLKKNKKRC